MDNWIILEYQVKNFKRQQQENKLLNNVLLNLYALIQVIDD